ncbi:hypothetical protein [Elizabethkingia meningoseptica]|uniref:hypothetical protein n=1 Tax=Elizabethkingia meningoseptica TaxID=238 RepID=UPI00315825EA
MKTKYVKVPVSERLPKDRNDVIVIDEYGQSGEAFFMKNEEWSVYNRDVVTGNIDFWLEEVPDHSEEMLYMLEDCLKSLEYVYKNARIKTISEGYEDEIENILYRKQELEILINKVKDNGK